MQRPWWTLTKGARQLMFSLILYLWVYQNFDNIIKDLSILLKRIYDVYQKGQIYFKFDNFIENNSLANIFCLSKIDKFIKN